MNSNLEYIRFVGQCLTLDVHPERKAEVESILCSSGINWEKIVAVTSSQLVMPAFYILLKRHGLLHYLPEDLVEYLDQITQLNSERNTEILKQVVSIQKILVANNIQPVFLKGTAHLLSGLYKDQAERMIGDIDILVPEDKMEKAAAILMNEEGYCPIIEYKPESFKNIKHFPRLTNQNYVAAVEVHKEVLNQWHTSKLKGKTVITDKQMVVSGQLEYLVPSIKHLVLHNILNAQINDKGYTQKAVLLRNMYDMVLLAQNTNVENIVSQYKKHQKIFRSYFAAVSLAFSSPKGICSSTYKTSGFYLWLLKIQLSYPLLQKINRIVGFVANRLFKYISLPLISIFDSNERKLLYYRISRKEWYISHFNYYVGFIKKLR